jgi:O-antigen ligase
MPFSTQPGRDSESVPVRVVRGLMEAVVLGMVCLSPWAFGSVHPYFEYYLFAGVAALVVLWGVRMLLEGEWRWQPCPLVWCLAGLWLWSLVQMAPVPRGVLAAVTPATADLYDELLPAQPEVLPGGQPASLHTTTFVPISLYAGASRADSLRLLAVLLLFVVVRNNLAGQGPLRRFSIAALANAALLALFALVQFFTSSPHTLYWTYSTDGLVFGPFICRTHFAFYVNLCVGLGLGLLLSTSPAAAGQGEDGRRPGLAEPLVRLLHESRALWLVAALALVLASDLLSMSRGAVVALAGAGVVCLLVRVVLFRRLSNLAVVGLLGLLVAGLLGWFGHERLHARLATLWTGQALHEGRIDSWSYVLPMVLRFPLTGTGLGTYAFVEPLERPPGQDPAIAWDHAHNDYLEAMLEGGLPRLALSLLAIGLVYRLGLAALRRHAGQPAEGLVLGCLFGMTTVVLHSMGDFGLHIPAIAVLATVMAAQLCGLAREPESGHRFGRSAAVLAALGCGLLAVLLVREAGRLERAERLRLAAVRLEPVDEAAAARQRALLAAALAAKPEDASLHLAYAEALAGGAEQETGRDLALVRAALRHYATARDLCPLLPGPHLRLAGLRPDLEQADPASAYLRRARQLRPSDPEVWYLAGAQELLDGHRDEAWQSWRHSLQCSDLYLDEIVRKAGPRLGGQGLAERILPSRPGLLLRAAELLPAEQRPPVLEKGLAALQELPAPAGPADLYLQARLCRALGRIDDASAAYRAALAMQPQQINWRFEWAELLYQHGQRDQARQQLIDLLAQQPGHGEARKLLETVIKDMVDGPM